MGTVIRIEEFEIDMNNALGKGSFGTVYEAINVERKEPAAAKQIYIKSQRLISQVNQEIQNMQKVSHKHLVKYFRHHKHQGIFWVFLELCDLGDLDKYFVNANPDRQQSLHLMQQTVSGLKYLHDNGVVHRDIKPQNILVKSRGKNRFLVVKITDFGLAKTIENSSRLSFTTEFIGTRIYMAPELFMSEIRSNRAVDIFALGITFFAMICFREGAEVLAPAEAGASPKDIGYEMYTLQQIGEVEKARNHHQKVVQITGSETEKKVRELILRMIPCDMEERVRASTVLENINEILHIRAIGNFQVLMTKELGKGRFGIVYEAESTDTEDLAAAKHIVIKDEDRNIPFINREIKSMKSTTHLNLVKVLHQYQDSKNDIWVFLEFCDLGDLDHYFVKNNPGEPEINDLMKQTARAIKFLHDNDIVHRGIKPQNVLLKSSKDNLSVVKITDFGFAKIIESLSTREMESSLYTAPELYDPAIKKCDKSADIFSLGLIFFAMINFKPGGQMLIPSDDPSSPIQIAKKMFEMAKNDELEMCKQFLKEQVPDKGEVMEKEIRELVQKMIPFEERERLSIDEVVEEIEKISPPEIEDSVHRAADSGCWDNLDTLTVLKTRRQIHAFRSDSENLIRAADVTERDNTKLNVRVWDLANREDQSWSDRDFVVDLANKPLEAEVIVILENMLLLRVRLDDDWNSQVIAVDLNGRVLHKSEVYVFRADPGYCCYRSQVLILDKASTSITQLDAETLSLSRSWTDERVKEPRRVCSNRHRAAVYDDDDASVLMFKWEDEQLSHDMIFKVKFIYCRGIQLLPDNALMGINKEGKWSVWSENGTSLFTTEQHPTLVPEMGIYPCSILQDSLSGAWFIQALGELHGGIHCTIIYDLRIVLSRLQNGDRSLFYKTNLTANTTMKFK